MNRTLFPAKLLHLMVELILTSITSVWSNELSEPSFLTASESAPSSPKVIWVDAVRGTAFGERGNRKRPFREIGSIISTEAGFVTNGALSVARPGDTIRISSGNFTNASSIWCIPRVKLQGAGVDRTFLYATNCDEFGNGGPVVVLSSGSICRDFTIVCSTNTAQAGIGTDHRGAYRFLFTNQPKWQYEYINAENFTNALVQRVKVSGGRDCVYVLHTNGCSAVFKDCVFNGNWDGGILFGSSTSHLDFRRCRFTVDGSLPADLERTYVDGFLVESGTVNFKACSIVAINGSAVSYGIRNLGGTVRVTNSHVITFGSPRVAPFGNPEDAPVNLVRSTAFTKVKIDVVGKGEVVPDYNGRLLRVGDVIRPKPRAASGYVWAGWSGITSNETPSAFVVEPNLSLQAIFVPVPSNDSIESEP